MNVIKAEFMKSASDKTGYPDTTLPEIAFVGRSNVGKSSLINKVTNRKKLVKVSSSPGKTALINFFNIDDKLIFTDLPGYGYAKVSKTEQERWGMMIEEYLKEREQLSMITFLLDIRHQPSENDVIMLQYLRETDALFVIAATKCDKIAKTKVPEHLEVIRQTLHLSEDEFLLAFSAETGFGVEELLEYYYKKLY